MNSRQRRGIILLTLSIFLAFAAFVGVLSVVSDVESKVGPEVAAYELSKDVDAYAALDESDVTKVTMPKRWLSANAVTDPEEIAGKIAVNPLKKGSLLQTDMMAERPELKDGEQEIAIMIDAATGVAGKITPGATVNIYATFKDKKDNELSRLLVNNARVIDVGKLTAITKEGENERRESEAVPITFALDTTDTHRVSFAESFAVNVRLALVAPGSDAVIPDGERDYTLNGDR
ncbi:Flp pilus assembly protein CpaB [Streptomyces gobiensis]|uniref:Flp pilus assembly protein CpaB n=1 Tax=Streptomyces gobiensis TaxID=2875706 RepID=UPI001E4CFC7B|nr:Flp pilus assembly protein CpaB [Streptomyces gobiensis]UGY93360.1 Flp pilus assembly protein CpaB [Streptomyces gobiensis]